MKDPLSIVFFFLTYYKFLNEIPIDEVAFYIGKFYLALEE